MRHLKIPISPSKIRYLSDLHLEMFSMSTSFRTHMNKLVPEHADDADSVLIAAGDISSSIEGLEAFLEEMTPRFQAIILIAGNHEYYGHIRQEHDATMKVVMKRFFEYDAVYVGLENAIIEFDNFVTIAGTLWADGGKTPVETLMMNKYLRCLKVIQESFDIPEAPFVKTMKYTAQMMRSDNLATRRDFKEALDRYWEKPIVVASHYIPFRSICHPRFGGQIDGGFASDCFDVIEKTTPAAWIFGHTHDTYHETVNGIPMHCNPSGYRHEYGSEFNEYQIRFIEIADLPAPLVKL